MQQPASLVDLDRAFRIDEHIVDPRRREVRHGERVVSINPKELEVLREMARRPGRVISKEALLDAVWGETVVVEHALTNAVHRLRKAFGDTPRKPRIIRTVHRRGYELIARVEPAATVALDVLDWRGWPPADRERDPASEPSSSAEPADRAPFAAARPESPPSVSPRVRGRLWIVALGVFLLVASPEGTVPTIVTEPLPVVLRVVEEARGAISPAEVEAYARRLIDAAGGLTAVAEPGSRSAHLLEIRVHGDHLTVASGQERDLLGAETWSQGLFERLLRLTLRHQNRTGYLPRMRAAGTISTEVVEQLDKGQRAHARSDLHTAAQHYRAALDADADDPAALERRATYYQGHLQVDDALRDARAAEREAGLRGASSTMSAVRLARAEGDLRRAERLLRDAIHDNPDDRYAYYQLLWQALVRRRDCRSALALHREIEALAAPPAVTGAPPALPRDYWWFVTIACVACGDVESAENALLAFEGSVTGGSEEGEVDLDALATVHTVRMGFHALLGDRQKAVEHRDAIPVRPLAAVGGQRFVHGGPHAELHIANFDFLLGDLESAVRRYASLLHGVYPRWASLATQGMAMTEVVRGGREKAADLLVGKIIDLSEDQPTAAADIALADHMLPLRGLLGIARLLDGDAEDAQRQLERLRAIRAQRIATNGGPPADGRRYNVYQEEWLHLLEGLVALHVAGDAARAEQAFDALLAVEPYADATFVSFVGWLAVDRPVLRRAVDRMPFRPSPIGGG